MSLRTLIYQGAAISIFSVIPAILYVIPAKAGIQINIYK
jgi:hypothetical protein